MINSQIQNQPVYKTQNLYEKKVQANNTNTSDTDVKTAIFYINDIHGQMSKLDKIKYASDCFSKAYQNDKSVDTLKLSGGDIKIGQEESKNNIMVEFLNMIGIDYSVLGNHEFDCGVSALAKHISKAKFKFIASNLNLNGNKPLQEAFNSKKLVESDVITQNGHSYGIIGAVPVDIEKRLSDKKLLEGVKVMDLEKTAVKLQEEIDKFQKKGINKIILTSHIGYENDLKLAAMLSGVDIIVGGHSHTKVEGLEGDKNIVESKSGEPVLVLQTGKDGENVGILNAEFDKDGIIKSANNVLLQSKEFPKDPAIDALKDKYLGKSINIGTIKETCDPQNINRTENPLTNLMTDGMRMKSGAQVALINSRNIRGMLEKGAVTNRNIQELSPFKNKLYKVEISEKDLIDSLKVSAQSIIDPDCRPGLMQVSGLKYTVNMFKEIKDVSLVNADGSLTPIDVNNPNPNNKITAVYDEFLFKGKEGYSSLKDKKVLEEISWDKPDAAIEFIQKKFNGKEFELKPDGRIKVEANVEEKPKSSLAEKLIKK
ncbi:MAG: 5'-nucleotidase C-terminal domain-containing protein [bacterium]